MSLDNTISDTQQRARFELERLDWLAVAIHNVGGISKAAKQLGVSQMLLCSWLENGLSRVKFESVVKLSELGDVPLEFLARRLRKHPGQPKTGSHKQTTRRSRLQ